MRRGALAGVLLVVFGAALGATVLREPIATAASPFQNVIIGNDSTNPVPVAEQNRDANGNVRVRRANDGVEPGHEPCVLESPDDTPQHVVSPEAPRHRVLARARSNRDRLIGNHKLLRSLIRQRAK